MRLFGRVDDEGDGFDGVELTQILRIVSGPACRLPKDSGGGGIRIQLAFRCISVCSCWCWSVLHGRSVKRHGEALASKLFPGELSSSTVWKANARSWTASCPHCRKSVPDWRTVYRNLGLQATKARSECDPGLHHTFSVPVACCVVKSEAFPRA